MTAIVGILNKHGIAVAADSAETIGSGVKIFNKANKIFTLSKYEPVGVVVYGDAMFGGLTPWDIVLKMYRKELGKTKYATLKEYVYGLCAFLEGKQFLANEADIKNVFNNQVYLFFHQYIINNRLGKGENEDFLQKELEDILHVILNECASWEVIEAVKDITKDQFESYIESVLNDIKNDLLKRNISYIKIKDLLINILYIAFTRKEMLHAFSGIALFGYGENEIYPRLFELKIYGPLCGKLKWYVANEYEINNSRNSSWICPLAQSDVMLTILRGIEPQLLSTLYQLMSVTLNDYTEKVAKIIENDNKDLANSIRTIDRNPSSNLLYQNINTIINDSHVIPLMNTISTLQKEDLAEVAENLIYLTSLMRRITPDQESVGGPIDVALLSKGDGFIWIKRKHYFEKSLNESYFTKYLMDNQ